MRTKDIQVNSDSRIILLSR